MGAFTSRARRFCRRLRRIHEGMGPGVSKMAPGDPEYCEYARYLYSPRRMIMSNFVAGLARGIGMAVGFSLLGAFVVYLLQQLAYRNIPVLGDFLARVIEAVQARK
jgi:hypothetical protein